MAAYLIEDVEVALLRKLAAPSSSRIPCIDERATDQAGQMDTPRRWYTNGKNPLRHKWLTNEEVCTLLIRVRGLVIDQNEIGQTPAVQA